jgi:hypothetical protein
MQLQQFPGQHILADVVISHSLAPGWVKYSGAARGVVARKKQLLKHKKYTAAASQQDARLLPFSVESCGGMAPDAITLLHVISEAGQEHLGLWPRDQIVRQLLGSVAIAVQKGNAMAVLSAHSRATARASASHCMQG